jgi:hypothetical protein
MPSMRVLWLDIYAIHKPHNTRKLENTYLRTQHSSSNKYYNIKHYDGPLVACLGVGAGNYGYGDGFGLRQRGRQRHLGSRPM